MPMAINSADEYEKVMNVSWFTHDKSVEDMTCVATLLPDYKFIVTSQQVSMRASILTDVPALLYRYP